MDGLRDLHGTIDDATEALTAFVSITRSCEFAPEILVEVANKVVSDLAEWRANLRQIVALEEVNVTSREPIPRNTGTRSRTLRPPADGR